ncbi:MAG TPA: MarR family transcriptional regulator [Acidimicrobiales bacterium]|nr:MarR family transcriptional regulator [Acidimicrobiales bacterium]
MSPTGTPVPGRPVPLNPAEERAWRALARAFIRVPRLLESELEAEHHLTTAEYFVLVNLSEEPDRALRMTELAERGALSLSGMSRVVDRLVRQGCVERRKCPSDARGNLAVLTDAGLDRLEDAYPTHLRGVRRHVMDHLQGVDLDAFAAAVNAFADAGCPGGEPANC